MYAILDIETTGGQFNEEGITEIAIYRYDGHEVVDQFISLVNPEIPIQPFVVKLTGINNAMLRTAPKFHEVAKRIIEITSDCILVAHNASFDYRILRTEFRRLGYDFQTPTLCTVELAQKLIPEQPSYSLGKLVRALGIPMADRHRAGGDALATVKLFKMLFDKDIEKTILKQFIKTEVEKGLTPKLLDIVDKLPSRTGIYYIHNEGGEIIFIGRSRNIKKRVNQHFTGSAPKCKKIQSLVFAVTYEETGSELIAQLKEIEEININRPMMNKAPARIISGWGVYSEPDANGYLNLKVRKGNRNDNRIVSFATFGEAQLKLAEIGKKFDLCQKLTGLYDSDEHCHLYTKNLCDGACIGEISSEEYNLRVLQMQHELSFYGRDIVLLDRGRNYAERSAILIENGRYVGYTFFDLNYQVTNVSVLRNIIAPTRLQDNLIPLIQSYFHKSKSAKLLHL
ncbi:MAG: GIY-YIG nuclease family protein [Flavobacterium sp.]|nr:GIY-YIG nuclease family protein [Flavobacterium sp.]